MLTLVIQQTLSNGEKKVWRLRPQNKVTTFGSSRQADVISIDPLAKGIQGVFEYYNEKWHYTDLDRAHVQKNINPTISIEKNMKLSMDSSELSLEIINKDLYVFTDPESFESTEKTTVTKKYDLIVVKNKNSVIETKVVPVGTFFEPTFNGPDIKVFKKQIDLSDKLDLTKVNPSDYFDHESRSGAYVVLAAAFVILGLGVFSPKPQTVTEIKTPPRATKVVVMTNPIKKKSNFTSPKPEVKSQASAKPSPSLKSFSAGRISQMLGKVSAQAAKTQNVIVTATGLKASPEQGGRALAALGPLSKAGKDWSNAAQGTAAGVSTVGRGGGKSSGSFGTLSAGNTGNAGVGLIEDESEVIGGLDRDVIAQYIKTQLGQILYCYERQLSAHPELEGKVAVRFTIGSSGKVEEQIIGDTTLKNATVEGCILNRVAQWKFPTPQGGTKVNVTYPFLFKSTN